MAYGSPQSQKRDGVGLKIRSSVFNCSWTHPLPPHYHPLSTTSTNVLLPAVAGCSHLCWWSHCTHHCCVCIVDGEGILLIESIELGHLGGVINGGI